MRVPRKNKGVEKNHEIKPHFLTIIVSPSLQLQKLRLPKKFARDHSKHLPNFAYLGVPKGADWPVKVNKYKGSVWLSTGWNQFAEYYSLGFGSLLVFRYDGNSRFRVCIFSTTGVEIDYSRNILHQIAKQTGKQGIKDDNLDGLSAKQKANAFDSKHPYFIVPMRKRHVFYKLGPVFPTSHCKEYFIKDDNNDEIVLRINKRTWCLKYRFEKKATFFISLSSGWIDFMLENGIEQGNECVFELIDSAKKVYNVYTFRDSEDMTEPTLGDEEMKEVIPEIESIEANENTLTNMLDELQQQTERKSSEELTSQRRSKPVRKTLCDAKHRVEQIAKAFESESENPFFVVPLTKRNLQGNSGPVIPVDHGRKYYTKKDHTKSIAVRVNEKIWPIKCRLEKFGSFCLSLSVGWKMFVLDNDLQEGDICIFELIDSARKTYKAHMFRISEHQAKDEEMKDEIPIKTSSKKDGLILFAGRRGRNAKLPSREAVKERLMKKAKSVGDEEMKEVIPTIDRKEANESTLTNMLDELQQHPERKSSEELGSQRRSKPVRKILYDAKHRVEQIAAAFESENPFFKVHLTQRNFKGNSGPVITADHGRKYYTKNDHNKSIAVRVNEKTWDIKCRLEKFGSFYLALSVGWKMFVLDNDLQEGDICVFELIDSARKTYKAHMFRISEHQAKDEEMKDEIPIETSRWRGRNGKLASHEAVKERLMKKANEFVNGRRGFIIRMNKSYIVLDRTVHIPLRHSKKYLKDDGDDGNVIVIHGKGKRSWKIKYRIEELFYTRLSASEWSEFRTDSGLAIGDVCAFKMVPTTPKAYKVAIFRVNGK